jgi:YD repeat-containing protein
MTARERWGLRGPVRTCRLERTWSSGRVGDERHDAAILVFRRDGALVSHWHQNHDGSSWKTTHEYDDLGRLVRVRTDNATGEHTVQSHEYDEEGRLSRIVERTPAGERVVERYDYDVTGRKQKTYNIDSALQQSGVQYALGTDGSDISFSVPGAARIVTLHDHRDRPHEVAFHDGAGALLMRTEFVYDAAGHLVEERVTRTVDALPPDIRAQMNPAELEAVRRIMGSPSEPARVLHRSDERGRRVETRSCLFGSIGEDRTTIVYNGYGDPAEEVTEDEHREVDIGDSGELIERQDSTTRHRSKARFDYEYDDRGNWVKKAIGGSSIERRTLVYYD